MFYNIGFFTNSNYTQLSVYYFEHNTEYNVLHSIRSKHNFVFEPCHRITINYCFAIICSYLREATFRSVLYIF